MADGDQQMPDFAVIVESLNEVSRAHASLATHFHRMGDIPAFDGGARILEAIADLSRRVDERFDSMDLRLDRMDSRSGSIEYNSMARQINGHATSASTPLSPLRDSRNRDVEDFPRDWAAIDAMQSNRINELLTTYGLPVFGDITLRRKQLKKFIGFVMVTE